jgi:hypothetical protein
MSEIVIEAVNDKRGRARFVDLGREFSAQTPHSVPQLRSELLELVTPGKNPFFGHADAELFIAKRAGKPVGRISAHIDRLALELPADRGFGPGTGMFGYFDAADEEAAHALLHHAQQSLKARGMTRVLGPISMSIWEEPGLLVKGHDHSPMIMMGHDPAHYQGWIESAGYSPAKSLFTYDLDVKQEFPPLIQRIVKSGERNERISVREVKPELWDEEVKIILTILNDAWSNNWGFVPFTPEEIKHAGKKLKPIIHPEINMIAELDGKPVAFMLTFPDMNDALKDIGGKLFPFGWIKLLAWLKKPKQANMRVPLMGVVKELHNSRLASQLAFMMINHIRYVADTQFHAVRGEVGWVLDDNQGMNAIAEAINAAINREYIIYSKTL